MQSVLPRRRTRTDEAFTLVEILVSTTVLVIVMSAMGPLFYGAMRLTGTTGQRSQATNLAVAATEQMRSLPYSQVGFYSTEPACDNNSETPVTLTSPGPLDALPATTTVGRTTFTVVRCVYWSASSMPGSNMAYKQTLVKVSWAAAGGNLAVSQTSALYPGSYGSGASVTPTTAAMAQVDLPPVCTATTDPSDPSSLIDVSWTPASGTAPSYYVVYYTTYAPSGSITAGSDPYTTSPAVYNTATVVTVGQGTTYYFQVSAVAADGTMSAPSTTCSATTASAGGAATTTTTTTLAGGGGTTTTTTLAGGGGTTTTTTSPTTATTYSSAASATAVDLALGGGSLAYTVTSPGTSATNDGTGSNSPVVAQPTVAVPGADSFLSVTAATQIAEANTDGSSYACAGVLSSGDTLTGGSAAGPCSVSGSGTGGVSLDIGGLPGVGAAIDTIVAGLTLNLDGATSWAAGNSGGSSLSGSASLTGATVTVTPLGGAVAAQTIPLNLPATLTSSTDVVNVITTAISGDPAVSSLAAPLQTALASVLTLTGDYQTTSGGVLTVTALHIGALSTAGTGDLAVSSVGPNQATTVPICLVNSLVVTPSQGTNGGGVALTSSGTLADESSFQLSVNVSPGCNQVEVGYAPSGCVPGASGCATTYAPMTGTSGTFYGSAGTASTVWQVGTTTFTVFTGTTPDIYSPLTQQQVILCTEQGSSGQC